MSNILITGFNSFIGTNYIKYSQNTVIGEVCLIKNKVENIDFKGADIVLHVAGIVHQTKSILEETYYRINTNLSLEIAGQAKKAGVKQFIFMSTVKVYGEFKDGTRAWNEETECKPEDAYGRSKFKAEQELQRLNTPDFIISIIRTPLVYGTGVKANMANIIKLVKNFPILPFKKIQNKRSFTYIENLIGFIDRIVELNVPGVFIAKDERSLSTTELVSLLSEHLNKRLILIKIPDFIISIGKKTIPRIFDRVYGSLEMENSKTLKTLNYKPPYTPEEGIKRMLQ